MWSCQECHCGLTYPELWDPHMSPLPSLGDPRKCTKMEAMNTDSVQERCPDEYAWHTGMIEKCCLALRSAWDNCSELLRT